VINKITLKRKQPNDMNNTSTYSSDQMQLLDIFIYGDYAFLVMSEEEIKDDIENDRYPSFTFLDTELLVKDHYFCLKHFLIVDDLDKEEEEYYSNISLFATQSEFFRLAKEYNELSKENIWKKIEITFDGKVFDIKVLEEFDSNNKPK
jgi:hypothetical protein